MDHERSAKTPKGLLRPGSEPRTELSYPRWSRRMDAFIRREEFARARHAKLRRKAKFSGCSPDAPGGTLPASRRNNSNSIWESLTRR
jgi:hypothetical protein